ncbi:guanylate kinase [Zavarzinella formosa]|uniref:guanylate kinase n=1 Tax=Zavarzinella formosa TaxID=360055 RepID=UPI0007C488EB|nr:guanylate kinase [Zavarzinella formosa]
MTLGPLIIVSGPSGSGKSTLIGRMIARFSPRLRHSISATTRKARSGEEDGIHYHFWTPERFEQGIAAGEFLEYATVFGRHYYGTPKTEVESYREAGVGVILDIDVQGAAQIKHNCPSAFLIFLMTPEGEYAKRLRARGKDSEEDIIRRIAEARSELTRANEFDVRLLNDDLEQASDELNQMIDGLLNGRFPEKAS